MEGLLLWGLVWVVGVLRLGKGDGGIDGIDGGYMVVKIGSLDYDLVIQETIIPSAYG